MRFGYVVPHANAREFAELAAWVESWWSIEPGPAGLAEVRRRIEAGPPGP